MNAGWNAGCVRATALAARRPGLRGARRVAAATSLEEGIAALATTMYGSDVRPGQGLATAQRAVTARVVWLLRVLAGWFPPSGAAALRVLLGPVEIANVADHLLRLAGGPVPAPVPLGRLATAWSRVAGATSPGEVRAVLRTSVWGDPGGEDARDIVLAMRLSLADRMIAALPGTRAWVTGAAALLMAREVADGRPLPPRAATDARRVLGAAAARAHTVTDLAAAATAPSRWVFAGLPVPPAAGDLWRAEAGWWARVEADAGRLARLRRAGPEVLTGAVALLAADAWRVRGALDLAARGGGDLEQRDAAA